MFIRQIPETTGRYPGSIFNYPFNLGILSVFCFLTLNGARSVAIPSLERSKFYAGACLFYCTKRVVIDSGANGRKIYESFPTTRGAASTSNTEVIAVSRTKSNNHDRTSTNTKLLRSKYPQ